MAKILIFLRGLLDKVVDLLDKVTRDCLLHFIAGLVISAFFQIVLGMGFFCFVPALFAGFLKEFIDLYTGGTFDAKEMLTTTSGGFLIAIFTLI